MRIAALIVICVAAPAQIISIMRILTDTELTGTTYRQLTVSGSDVKACAAKCREDAKCAAFSLTKTASESSFCDLKSAVGSLVRERKGVSSGIIRSKSLDEAMGVSVSTPPTGGRREGQMTEQQERVKEQIFKDILSQYPIPPGARVATATAERPGGPRQGPDPSAGTARSGAPAGSDVPPLPQARASAAPTVPVPAASLTGDWTFPNADKTERVRVTQTGSNLTFTDASNRNVQARVENGDVVVDAWKMRGIVGDAGKEIRWTNGSVWTKSVSDRNE